tara:strand:- start:831 stop:1085 length:255 start_codon:yes stop_codon:yes gene_type:complete
MSPASQYACANKITFEHIFGVARGEWRGYRLLQDDDVALRTNAEDQRRSPVLHGVRGGILTETPLSDCGGFYMRTRARGVSVGL